MNNLTGMKNASPEIKIDIIASGPQGERGKSAYEIWLERGNTGSEEDFLLSLKGEKGEKGDTPSIAHLEEAVADAINDINTTNQSMIEAEQQRKGNEQLRESAEGQRILNEQERQSNEEQRDLAEQLRRMAEFEREKYRIFVSDTEPENALFWLDTSS